MTPLVAEIVKIGRGLKAANAFTSLCTFSVEWCGTNRSHFGVMIAQNCVSARTALHLANTLADRGYTEEAARLNRRIIAEADVPREKHRPR